MCNVLPKLTIGNSPDATDYIIWGKSFLDTAADDYIIGDWFVTLPDQVEVFIPPKIDFESMSWELPKKKKNYGKHTKHINKVLKKMGR